MRISEYDDLYGDAVRRPELPAGRQLSSFLSFDLPTTYCRELRSNDVQSQQPIRIGDEIRMHPW